MRTAGQLTRHIEAMEPGEEIEIHLTECPKAMIEVLKCSLAAGILQPKEEMLQRFPERFRDLYRTGEWMDRDMTYIKEG